MHPKVQKITNKMLEWKIPRITHELNARRTSHHYSQLKATNPTRNCQKLSSRSSKNEDVTKKGL